MGGIDEAALDRLSLVTEMSKRIRVRASGEKSSASEIGQFSPIFVWLLRVRFYCSYKRILCIPVHPLAHLIVLKLCSIIFLLYSSTDMLLYFLACSLLMIHLFLDLELLCLQDFYLDLVEDNRRITPRDYLEIALRPVQGSKRDVAAKNEVGHQDLYYMLI